MAAFERSRAITDVYRSELMRLRTDAVAQSARLWGAIDPEDITGTLDPVLGAIDTVLQVAQSEAVRIADLYYATFLTSELETPVDPVGLDPGDYSGRTRDGRSTASVLALTASSMFAAAAVGATSDVISTAGLARATRVVRTESVDAARTAQNDLMRDDSRVEGSYRATSGMPCAACLGLAGARIRAGEEAWPIHGSCACTAEPIASGVPDRHRPRDGREIARDLGADRTEEAYGEARASVLAGSGALTALVVTRQAHSWGSMLFAAPASSIEE